MKTYTSYAQWFRDYRATFRAENDGKTDFQAVCTKLQENEPEYASRLEYELKDPDWWLTSDELISAGKLNVKVGAKS